MSDPEAVTVGSETILVEDDESGVLKLIAESLRSYGYAAIAVPNSLDALEMAGREQLRVDLLLTDVQMPDMNGPNLAAAWRMLRPNLKVLFMPSRATMRTWRCWRMFPSWKARCCESLSPA